MYKKLIVGITGLLNYPIVIQLSWSFGLDCYCGYVELGHSICVLSERHKFLGGRKRAMVLGRCVTMAIVRVVLDGKKQKNF